MIYKVNKNKWKLWDRVEDENAPEYSTSETKSIGSYIYLNDPNGKMMKYKFVNKTKNIYVLDMDIEEWGSVSLNDLEVPTKKELQLLNF